MKRFFFAAALTAFLLTPSFSQEISSAQKEENPQKNSGWIFAVEPVFGTRFGKEGEIVWSKNSQNGRTYKLSELEWQYLPAFYLGGNFALSFKRFEASFSPKFFLPSHFGLMKDSDWQQDAGYATGNTSLKTNYSQSENRLKGGSDLELLFTFKFYPAKFLTLRPRLSVNYTHMNFSGFGGELWYGHNSNDKSTLTDGGVSYYAWNDSPHRTYGKFNDEAIINYDSKNIFLWAGIQADFIPSKNIVITLATDAAIIYYTYSIDNHLKTGRDYLQYSLSVFYGMRQNIGMTVRFRPWLSLCINISGVFTGETAGPTFYKYHSSDKYSEDLSASAGSYSMYIDAAVSVKFSW